MYNIIIKDWNDNTIFTFKNVVEYRILGYENNQVLYYYKVDNVDQKQVYQQSLPDSSTIIIDKIM